MKINEKKFLARLLADSITESAVNAEIPPEVFVEAVKILYAAIETLGPPTADGKVDRSYKPGSAGRDGYKTQTI